MKRLVTWRGVGILGAWMVATSLHAGSATTSAEFLKIGAGPRAAAMGDAAAALSDDAFALAWNPAGLGTLSVGEAVLSHNRWFGDTTEQRALAALPLRSAGTVALGFHRLAVDDFMGFDAQSTPTQSLTSGASSLSLGWGKNFAASADRGSGLFGGLTIQTLQEEHAGATASGFAADVGFLLRPWGPDVSPIWRRLGLGAALRHLGQAPSFDKENAPLPTEYAVGAAYTLPLSGDLATWAVEGRRSTDDGTTVGVGVEYWVKGLLALRGGYRSGGEKKAGLRAGAGFRLGRAQLDYAWSALGDDLDAAHRVAVTFRFGAVRAPGVAADLFDDFVAKGRRHRDLGLYDRAVLDFQEALRIHPENEEITRLLLECAEKMRSAVPAP